MTTKGNTISAQSGRLHAMALSDILCTACGLCCSGALFADVEISRREGSKLELLGLSIEDDDGPALLLQPCAALKDKRCAVYSLRPKCCRTFECRLLQETQRGMISIDQAMAKVDETLELISRVEGLLAALPAPLEIETHHLSLKERCEEALARAEEIGYSSSAPNISIELGAAVAALDERLEATFL